MGRKSWEDEHYEAWDKEDREREIEKQENRHYGEYWEDSPTYNHDSKVSDSLGEFYKKLSATITKKPLKDQIDDLELFMALGGNFSDLWKLFDIEPKEAGPERTEWLEFVAGQARKYALEVALKTRERLQNERYLRKIEKEKTNAALANTGSKPD